MFATKTIRFFARYAASDPLKFTDMVRRHVIERYSRMPDGLAGTRVSAASHSKSTWACIA